MPVSLFMKVSSSNSDLHTVCAESFFSLCRQSVRQYLKLWDRSQIVRQYLKLWYSITNRKTVSQIVRQHHKSRDSISNCETVSQIVRQYLKLWDSILNCETLSQIVRLYLKLWDSISNFETVSKIVRQYLKLWDSISNYATTDSLHVLEHSLFIDHRNIRHLKYWKVRQTQHTKWTNNNLIGLQIKIIRRNK